MTNSSIESATIAFFNDQFMFHTLKTGILNDGYKKLRSVEIAMKGEDKSRGKEPEGKNPISQKVPFSQGLGENKPVSVFCMNSDDYVCGRKRN